ncbi:DNA repair (Rad57) [Cordyceps militaris]|uniref:DNA repair (Rad57) n=1 Tax=Cordyceps militaris TaxID=73501 RepID=A0A2H4SWE4_CORMI|nr:DNA repair (Rad57) [Cordyceps militaris]
MQPATLHPSLDLAVSIGSGIYLYEPPAQPRGSHPALIILSTWLGGATPRRISKYVAGYRELYSNSAILVLTTKIADITVRPVSALHARLQPARDTIRRIVSALADDGVPSILFHIFSHGGCNTALQLIHSFQSEPVLDDTLDFASHLYGIIFDCCPGDGSFDRAYNAAAASLPDALLMQAIGKMLLVPFIGTFTLLQHVGAINSVADMRRELNDRGVFGTTAKRLYLYSSEDQMVQWQDVETHLEAARSVSEYPVTGVRFTESAHCAIIRNHSEKYWKAVDDFWQTKSCKPQSRL